MRANDMWGVIQRFIANPGKKTKGALRDECYGTKCRDCPMSFVGVAKNGYQKQCCLISKYAHLGHDPAGSIYPGGLQYLSVEDLYLVMVEAVAEAVVNGSVDASGRSYGEG